ncbi:MAG: DUF2491 family protein, partial [Pseudomonadota bacterium]
GSADDDADLPEELGPLGVAIGGAIEIDALGVQAALASGTPAIVPPVGGTFIVAAVGTAKLDTATELTRYYDNDDRILQLMSSPDGGMETVDDVSLYRPWDSVVPMTDAEWTRWTGRDGMIGQPRYDADGLIYDRFWGDGEGRVDLVEFTEDINDGAAKRAIHQMCMLYARPVGDMDEMLLINIEREVGAHAERQGGSVEFMIGYGLSAADIRRV